MKLQGKKTGTVANFIGYIDQATPIINLPAGNTMLTVRYMDAGVNCYKDYNTIKEFNEDWEDYKPAEPYIEDKKIRKFVRDWAEINGIKKVLVCESFHSWGFTNKNDCKSSDKEYMGADLLFRGEKPEELEFGKEYSITELCREEEE